MHSITHVAIIGSGVIGSSWAALFLAAGRSVTVYDPSPDFEAATQQRIAEVWPTLESLGMTERGDRSAIRFVTSAVEAVRGADFVQENVPERIEVKHALFQEIEPHLAPHTVVASSASGLMVSEMQAGWANPARFILGHPFNPPHLIPLVELVSNDMTDPDVIALAEAFYQDCGKVTIRVKKEVPAHVANRLQAALWREAIHLVAEGVASVEDVDKAVWAGPGLRWAAMGPHQLFHLGAGQGGLAEFCNRYGASFHRWWDDLGDAQLDELTIAKLGSGIAAFDQGHAEDTAKRDALIEAMLKHTRQVRDKAAAG
ncbi:MAG: 3-hydroxyacyl-CoA dehydrogenase NAD-binding domain-containing protein [Pseudomonadota bacterium]